MTSIPRADEPSLIDEPSVVHALRVTLVIIFASALAISAITLFLRWRLTPQLALVAGASSLVALVLSRSGRIRPAMMLPLLFITCAVLTLAVRSDGIQNIGLAILPVLILVGSLVLDRLTLVFFTASWWHDRIPAVKNSGCPVLRNAGIHTLAHSWSMALYPLCFEHLRSRTAVNGLRTSSGNSEQRKHAWQWQTRTRVSSGRYWHTMRLIAAPHRREKESSSSF
jgi:hypothetical protein